MRTFAGASDSAVEPQAIAAAAPVGETPAECDGSDVINWDELLDRCLGDEQLARKSLGRLECYFPGQLDELRTAVANGQAKATEEIAHALKGAASILSAHRLAEELRQMEQLGRGSETAAAVRQFPHVEREWSRVQNRLHALKNVTAGSANVSSELPSKYSECQSK